MTARLAEDGLYCLAVEGITPADAPLFVTVVDSGAFGDPSRIDFDGLSGDPPSVDFRGGGNIVGHAIWYPSAAGAGCDANEFIVYTWRSVSGTDENDDDTYLIEDSFLSSEPFTFMIP